MCQEQTLADRRDHARLACWFTLTGSVKKKVEPRPTTDSIQIRPPALYEEYTSSTAYY
jgi:hypothetical protein